LERLALGDIADEPTGTLPTGSGRMLELARALVTQPRILLLDEPASGQDEDETLAFDAVLRELCADGMAIALVEHDLGLVMRVCAHIYVLNLGRLIAEGSPQQVQADRGVQDAYLGQPV
jgi:branched-chain amino acid transport system ATP-binding protein